MSYQCPTCQRVLYNRRLKKCGFCGASISKSLRFTAVEIATLDKKMADLEEERAQRERAAAEEKEAQRKQAEEIGRYFSGIM
jgi:ribosomal protein L37E